MEFLGNLHPHGVFLCREAIALGVDQHDLYGALRRGALERVRHGAYVMADRWRGADEISRHALRAHAVALSHRGPMALSHVSGAVLLGMRTWNVDLRRVHVSRSVETRGHSKSDIAYHERSVVERVAVLGSPVMTPAACAVDAASIVGVEEGLVILDSAYDLGLCTPEDVRQEYLARINWPGTARLRITLPLSQAGSQSVGESRMRFLFWTIGVPRPVLQYPIDLDGRLVYSDFAWPDHGLIGEFDGRVKYAQHLRPGESPADAVVREKRREDQIREATGWSVIRFDWADLRRPAEVRERMRRALGRRD